MTRRRTCWPAARSRRRARAVTCAVSGGADSLALLVLAVEAGCEVTAVHVDHGLRPGSAARPTSSPPSAARVGRRVPRRSRSTVAAGPDLEARARRARYAALPADVLTGHTADDQAETVLLNLLRGAGLDGLAGFDPPAARCGACAAARPTRCAPTSGIQPVHDPSNDDPRFRRNRVRHELLPLLDAIAERDVAAVLARQADHLRADADLLDELAAGARPHRRPRAGRRPGAARGPGGAPLAARRAPSSTRPTPPPSRGSSPSPAARRSACEVGGGRVVRRHAQRLYVADRAG